ncbi:O-methyltransferase-domain-containing protein [Cladorrhinum samala]|uniref:O-methyltransferase-domain-containing protein n=1 Tax=Cladorrhinum samala TaxID=585594 RepID=A0AAV9HUT9_9PEZI|nr:O-methyltransferase-domain-containing protein [Cladorrhinum samala]
MLKSNFQIQRHDYVSIASLAQQISSLASQITSYLSSNAHPEPSFEVGGGVVPVSAEYEALRVPLNDAALDLLRLINGPRNTLRNFLFSHYDLASLQVALDRRFFHHVPLYDSDNGDGAGNKATITEVAEKAGMDENRTGRVLKMLSTHRIFEQVPGEPDTFRHTASSALLARDADFHAMADMQMDDMIKATSETSTMITSSPLAADHQNHSAFHQRFGIPLYLYLEQHPYKAKRFAQAMSSWSQIDRQITDLSNSYTWGSLGKGTVVDVGGGSGHISIALARQFPSLRFVVQDISHHMLSHAESSELGGRVTFQQHDFFQPQPVRGASVYLVRQVLHNYNDADSVKILAALVPALEVRPSATRLLINDIVLPDSHSGGVTSKYEEHHLRQVDFCMMVALGAKQRSQFEFDQVLKRADKRFEIVNVWRNPLGIGLVEVRLASAV